MARTKQHPTKFNLMFAKPVGETETKKPRKPYRFRPGTRAIREIKKYQRSTEYLMRKAPFYRLVRDIAQACMTGVRFKASALSALQTAAEQFMIDVLEDSNMNAIHAGRVTIYNCDLRLAMRYRKEFSLHKTAVLGKCGT